jgi:maleate isomerase
MTQTALADTPGEFRSRPVEASYELDAGPGDYRIGLLALSNDYVTERDFMNMRPGDGVAIYTSRLLNSSDCTVETLRALAPRLTEATALLIPEGRLDVVAYSCTSGSVVAGFQEIEASIQAARPGIPCITPITAGLTAFEALGVHKVAVLTPYIDEVNAHIVRYLEEHGMAVPRFTSFHMASAEDMAALPADAIHRAALEADCPEAEALFISCTAIRAVDVVQTVEDDLGKPVVTANQAMFWQSLRRAACTAPVPGYGRLFEA